MPSPIFRKKKRSLNKQCFLDTLWQVNNCLVGTKQHSIKMHICFRLYVIGKTTTTTDIWIDLNGIVKGQSFCQKCFLQ